MARHDQRYPRDNDRRLRETVKTLKGDLRSALKENRILRNELENIVKPVRPRRVHIEEKSPKEMTPEEWRRDFIRKYKPKTGPEEIKMETRLTRVVLESPFNGPTPADIQDNIKYARKCVYDCLRRGEAPLASHLLYTQEGILDDKKPEERKLGMNAGFIWNILADRVVVYTDRGISGGMKAGIALAEEHGIPVEYRKLEEISE